MAEKDFTLRDGSAVTVEYTIGAYDPDVGIMAEYAEEWWTTWLHGKTVTPGNTCYRREIDELMTNLEIEPYDPADEHDW